ncbi:MAG: nucleotidyltransferase family protein [Alphaproteobacteria bacterium]|nr:nucleotidyltransferase family protein [Alphaproteobacteria bacterium]
MDAAVQHIPAIRDDVPSSATHVRPAPTPQSLLAQSLIGPDTSIHTLIERFTTRLVQIGLVVDQQQRLLGTVTDGDLRRGLLRGVTTEAPVRAIMNDSPRTIAFGEPRGDVLAFMRREKIKHIPVVDFAGRAVDLITLDSLLTPQSQPYPVVLMAGGEGRRLRPLTEHTPKPMLDVGGRPILETIIRRFSDAGFSEFHISVNYRAEVIRNHFGDGRGLGVDIAYIEEDMPLGTAGPLGRLATNCEEPVLVMNADILSKLDASQMIDFHVDSGAGATMAVRPYEVQVPYGVVEMSDHEILGIREKPVTRHFINAGIYVLDPAAIDLVPRDGAFDMPQLFDACRDAGLNTHAYPVEEYWVDIGQMDDYRRANADFAATF